MIPAPVLPAQPRRRLLITGVPPEPVIERAATAFNLSVWRGATPIGAKLASEADGHDAAIIMPGDTLDADASSSKVERSAA